ncbi:MAG: hypothetical protein Q7R95_10725 [bacterium]|nr:hypothetical protein [bacterium]
MNKILELVQDRAGKLSAYKLSFLLGAGSMLFLLVKISLKTGELKVIPDNWPMFLGVLGSSQLVSTYLKNKSTATTVNTTTSNSAVITTP